MRSTRTNRRELLVGTASLTLVALSATRAAAATPAAIAAAATPLPLSAVRLRPSDYATAVEVNRAYLTRLDPDRLLHNFLLYAGMTPKGEIYGGWESDTIGGPYARPLS